MAAPLASSIGTKNFSAKFENILSFFSTYRRYFKHFFLLVDRTSIGIECVIIFHRFSLMYAKYFTVYFRRTIKFDARVANLILFYSNDCNVNVLRNDNNVARVKSKRIETSICSIINIKLSKPIFGLPMPLHYNTRKISLNLVCSLLFSHEASPKCRENYGDSLSVIYGIYDVT